MHGGERKNFFVAPLANLHCFRTHQVLAFAPDPLRFPGEKSLFFPWWGKGGLRKGKFIHPSDAEESSLFLPFLTALEESYKKGGEAQT